MALSELFEKARAEAVGVYLADGVLLPRLHCLRGDQIRGTYIILHDTDEWKRMTYGRILEYANQENIDGFIDVFEAWMATNLQPGQRPRNAPQRKEGVTMFGRQITVGKRETLVRIYEIVRAAGTVDLVLSPAFQPSDPDTVQAWFDPYLDKLVAPN